MASVDDAELGRRMAAIVTAHEAMGAVLRRHRQTPTILATAELDDIKLTVADAFRDEMVAAAMAITNASVRLPRGYELIDP